VNVISQVLAGLSLLLTTNTPICGMVELVARGFKPIIERSEKNKHNAGSLLLLLKMSFI